MRQSPIVEHILAERRRIQEQGLESNLPGCEPEYQTISFRVDKRFYEDLWELSVRSGVSMSQIIRSELKPGVHEALDMLRKEEAEIRALEAQEVSGHE